MNAFLFYLFAAVTLGGGVAVVINRNPVSSAFSMVVCFLGLAALFITLNAYFIGTIQILVYAGAIMVLFLFIIMLLDLKAEKERQINLAAFAGGIVVVLFFLVQFLFVLDQFEPGRKELEPIQTGGERYDDVAEIGRTIFTDFNFPLQVVGVLLLVATVGVVVLSRKEAK